MPEITPKLQQLRRSDKSAMADIEQANKRSEAMKPAKDLEANKVIMLEPQRIRAYKIIYYYKEMAKRKVVDDEIKEKERQATVERDQ